MVKKARQTLELDFDEKLQNQLGTELAGLSVRKGTGCGVTQSCGTAPGWHHLLCCGCCISARAAAALGAPLIAFQGKPQSPAAPRTAALVEWVSLGLEINPRGNAAEEEGM